MNKKILAGGIIALGALLYTTTRAASGSDDKTDKGLTIFGGNEIKCSITATPLSGNAPLTVTTMGRASFGSFVSMNRGEGPSISNPPMSNMTHTYTTSGTYTIEASVASNDDTLFTKCATNITVYAGSSSTGTGRNNQNGTGWTHTRADADVAIKWMHDKGLTKFDTYEGFRGDATITREQAAKFFKQFAWNVIGNPTGTNGNCTFSDEASIDPTLKGDVIAACQMGLFKGSKGKFNPKNPITGAELITVAMRLKYGMLSESGANRWSEYAQKAEELGLTSDLQLEASAMTSGAPRVNAALILYRLSQIMDTTTE